MNWRHFIQQTNPVIAALLSKLGYNKQERVQVKLEFLRMISRMELNPAKMELIYGFFETYLQLNEEEENQMQEKITKLPEEEAKLILKLPNSYYEKGIKKGIAEGIEKIVTEMLKKGLTAKYISELTNISEEKVKEIQSKNEA
ncbi:hypothetical protein P4489_02665 [Heyndrickxia sporothermodurans]|uniref:hypothetical protein n=1 Tax=Heyndrickxia sporothermodurans TaxID=46224 RepID=UPI002E210CF6|nr:hypothetical protein [Heyndrickxia sporothermodurans]